MALSVGSRLGRFEILGALGSGGVGDVYRARDPHLQREVAIKVLRPTWADDADRHRRLEQEARTAGSLNHPNIVAIHDVGAHEGAPFIVTELLEGETLRQRMNGRPLPPSKAIDFAVQTARGLAAGAERGIVHRDIKPDNLFVTRDGQIKILDFGLAKLVEPDAWERATATITFDGAAVGAMAGTAVYMSPEQARGLRADHRSDIFSLGAVLYEMLAGFPPFRRATLADTLSAILHEEPRDLAEIAPVAPALARVVQHCLEKDADDRFQSARDLIFDLESLPHSSTSAHRRRPAIATRRGVIAALALAAVATASGVGYLAGARRSDAQPADQRARRFTDFVGLEEFPAISPDGRSVAFTASVDGTRQIFVRLMAGGPPLAITRDPADHQQPRWSPDANSIFFFSPPSENETQGAIWSVPALGGSPRRIIGAVDGADVSRTGRLACFWLVDGKVQLVTAALDGSDARTILPSVAGYHRYPRWSPDGRWIAYQRGDGVRFDLFVVAAAGGEPRQLTRDRSIISGLAWLPTSDGVVYGSSRDNSIPYLPALRLWKIGLDGGAPRAITPPDVSYEHPDVNDSGLVSVARLRLQFDLWELPFEARDADRAKPARRITNQTGQVLTPTVSPNGDEVAFLADSGGHANLWVSSMRTRELRQITFESDPAVAIGVPVWSPDGAWIAFVSSKNRTGYDFGVWLVQPDGSNLRNLVKQGLGAAWSPDGRWLYYTEVASGGMFKIAVSGGAAARVRPETRNVIGVHGSTVYFMVERPLVDGRPEFEIRAASPEDGPSRLVGRIPASRVAPWQIVNPSLSPAGDWLALPLTDGFTTNVWALSTASGEWRRVTDFGTRATFIARRVSWTPDGKSIIASIGEGDADIVLLDHLIR
jgi:Tol biopolymer transport system component/tRNA A-37 threonylcarbamoyl transferase component Bud32